MVNEVVKTWLTVLAPLKEASLLTATYGLVRPGRIRVKNDRDFVIPVPMDKPEYSEVNDVDDGLLINSEQRSVLFVKGDSTKSEERGKGGTKRESMAVRVVLWFNTEKFETENGNVSSKFTSAVIALLEKGMPGNFDGYQDIRFERTGIVAGWRCFQDYTFREETGYLFTPYDSVGIDGNLTFYINEKSICQSPLLPTAFSSDC